MGTTFALKGLRQAASRLEAVCPAVEQQPLDPS